MNWVLILGLLIHAIALPIVLRRVWFLFRLVRHGQPAPDRAASVKERFGRAVRTEAVEVFGQRRLLQWTVSGLAHFFTFWAFVILATVYVEAYGVMLGPDDFAIPLIGHSPVLGFAQDAIALAVLVSITVFLVIRLREAPAKLGRRSRFMGSHEFGAYLVLFFILLVVLTMFIFRGAAEALGNFDNSGAFVSNFVGSLLDGLGHGALEVIEGLGLIGHLGVMLAFLIEVVHSKHLHLLVAPINVIFKRHPIALGAAKPLMSAGKPVHLDDVEDMDEDTRLGVGSIEDFSWKGILDLESCVECGRCQSQCPAWNTEKPLSPKLMIMALRDHAYQAGPYLLQDEAGRAAYDGPAKAEAERPLVGETEGDPWAPTGGGIIDPDVLWSCVNCGACVQQCPVDIEHVDHIVDMRRYQVLVESNFPAELNQLFRGLENKGNPWNMSPTKRLEWAEGLDFDVNVVGEDIESLDEVEWLFWVGCAGAYEDRAMKTTRAVAELLHIAGVSFGVLGNGETCTGDPARRAGNEFVFQGLASANIETFKEYKVKKAVSTCAHCFNTLKNEYKEFGIELEVVHHTQLLNRLVREGKLTPVADGAGAAKRSITYHDPCFIGRHNQVYEPPRELLTVLPGAEVREMDRSRERSFCCGAGGARMWMEETIGERINVNRTTEAVGTGADQIAVACPFCRVMLSDGLTALQDEGQARQEVEVLDVAQMLLASVKGVPATRAKAGTGPKKAAEADSGTPAGAAGDSAGGGTGEGALSQEKSVGAGAGASGGAAAGVATAGAGAAAGSLFDLGGGEAETAAEPEPPAAASGPAEELGSGGSLFDLGGAEPEPEPEATPDVTSEPAAPEAEAAAPAADEPELGTGGSLFDLQAPEEPAAETPEPATAAVDEPAAEPEPVVEEPEDTASAPETAAAAPTAEIPEGGSLFDIAAPAVPEPAAPAAEPAPTDATAGAAAEAETPSGAVDPAAVSGAFVADEATEAESGTPAAEAETEVESEGDDATEEKPVPRAGSEPGHQPRTDTDIDGSGSLFDL